MHTSTHLPRRGLLLGSAGIFLLAACGTDDVTPSASPGGARGPLGISAIPDQDPELLNRLYPALATRFQEATGLDVVYTPLTDYTAVVRAFEVGDIQLAWMGGLTGVQARARVPAPPRSPSVTSTRTSTACSSPTSPRRSRRSTRWPA